MRFVDCPEAQAQTAFVCEVVHGNGYAMQQLSVATHECSSATCPIGRGRWQRQLKHIGAALRAEGGCWVGWSGNRAVKRNVVPA